MSLYGALHFSRLHPFKSRGKECIPPYTASHISCPDISKSRGPTRATHMILLSEWLWTILVMIVSRIAGCSVTFLSNLMDVPLPLRSSASTAAASQPSMPVT